MCYKYKKLVNNLSNVAKNVDQLLTSASSITIDKAEKKIWALNL